MKRLGLMGLLMLAVCSVAASASAQAIAKGKNEVAGEISIYTARDTGEGSDDTDRFSSADVSVAYSRYLTDRVAIGPLVGITKTSNSDATGYLGGIARYNFGDLARRAVPLVEIRSSRTINDAFADYTTLQLLGGVQFALGKTGGRFRVTPYYYRAFFNEADSADYHSFGISWSAALLF